MLRLVQKNLLKQIISLGSTRGLKGYLNEEISKLHTELTGMINKVPKGIERIKLQESIKMLEPLADTEKVTDTHLVKLLQFYDLKDELGRL